VDQESMNFFEGLFRSLETEMNQRFDRAEARTDERFNRVDERFDRIEARLDRMEARLDKIAAAPIMLRAWSNGPRSRICSRQTLSGE
jgi:hypothetical protein